MAQLRVLHFEDSSADALLVKRAIENHGYSLDFKLVQSAPEYLAAVIAGGLDLILSDSGLPGFSGRAALDVARKFCPEVPFIFVSGGMDEKQALANLEAGATDFILKDHLWQLAIALRRIKKSPAEASPAGSPDPSRRATQRLLEAVQQLSLARSLEAVMSIVRTAARELTGADGATFILRDADKCFYADEDAISPLWKGQRFPMSACISGWTMLNRRSVTIEDVFADPRIPVDAYRPTFVKSLVMVPIRTENPIGAIGNYWAHSHRATPEEVELLEALANTTSAALENVQLFTELEQRVRDRTLDLEASNRELEAFSYSVSHDLRQPLRSIGMLVDDVLRDETLSLPDGKKEEYGGRLRKEVKRMSALIDDLLRLAKLSRLEMRRENTSLTQIAFEIVKGLRSQNPERRANFQIQPDLVVCGDSGLMRVVLENLLSNAWKYSARRDQAIIEFGSRIENGSLVYFVKDNGAGFDMQHAEKLFAPFQRLHTQAEFPGNGVGLATVQRIVQRHGGRIWTFSQPDQGATFSFTIP